VTSGGDRRPPIAAEDVGDRHSGSGRDRLKGFASRSLILKLSFRRPWFGLAGELEDPGGRLAGGVIGSGFAVDELWQSRRRIEATPHLSVSSDKFGCGPRFSDFGVAVHVGFLAFERRSGLFGPVIGFSPALPGNREAVVLQGRAERAGALRQPLAARPALAVAILFSFDIGEGSEAIARTGTEQRETLEPPAC
jgi:hypothetical protein